MLAKNVTADHIKQVLSEFIQRGALAGANKIRANLHAVFNFGLFADNDPANLNQKINYGLDKNPVTLVPSQRGANKALDRFLTWIELQKLLTPESTEYIGRWIHPDYAVLLKLCIFTGGQRPWELMKNTKNHWDKKNNTLTIPPHISKNGDFHAIPLCKTAVELLSLIEEKYPTSSFLFPAEKKRDICYQMNTPSKSINFAKKQVLINLHPEIFDGLSKH